MPIGIQPQLAFEHELRLEAERVLRDLIFQRAPMQSRLLRYLLERTITGGRPPTQYEIAVDGLGKDSDYDVEQDSYPRVQISRLRRNLDNYYARNLPGNGLRIQIDHGSYRLLLEAIERTQLQSDVMAEPDLAKRSGNHSHWAAQRGIRIAMLLATLAFAVIVFFAAMDFDWLNSKVPGGPTTMLIVDADVSIVEGKIDPSQVTPLRIVAERQLENSFVSSPLPPRSQNAEPSYYVKLALSLESGDPVVLVSLMDQQGNVIYADRVDAWDQEGSFSEAELEAALVYVTSPTGIIARHELRKNSDPESSDYTCFLSVENNRARGAETSKLVDSCIENFPMSKYRAFWHGRKAFAYYQEQAMRREPLTKSGPGWEHLRAAFEADQFNAFANFVSAKIELSQGRCERGRNYIDKALMRGSSYPIMVAAVEANALSCANSQSAMRVDRSKLRALADFNPDPDPLLHSYLVVGLIAANDMEAATEFAGRLVIDRPNGQVEEMSQLFRLSLEDPVVARKNRDELRKAVYFLVWNDEATNQIVSRIIG